MTVEGRAVGFQCREINSRPGGPKCVDRLKKMRGKYMSVVSDHRPAVRLNAILVKGGKRESRSRRKRLEKKSATVDR